MKKKPAAAPENNGEIIKDAQEATAIESYWYMAGRAKLRKPPKNYKYIEEIAHLQFELIKLQEWVRLQGLKVVVIQEFAILFSAVKNHHGVRRSTPRLP
jgi:polyphosphate kinase 2 (PPK2 family)